MRASRQLPAWRRRGSGEAEPETEDRALSRPSTPAEQRASGIADAALGGLAILLTIGAVYALMPLWVPLLLAAWFALIARPAHERTARWMRGKSRGAAVVTVLLVLAVLAPLAVIVLSLASDAAELGRTLGRAGGVPNALQALLTTGEQAIRDGEPKRLIELARQHGASALGVTRALAGATATAVIGLVVFVMGFYAFLVDGERLYRWIVDHAPLQRRHTEKFGAAFAETGRGLLIGVGLTAALQGAVAAVGYVVVGVPHALVLGLLTAIAGLIPAVGSALVWVPVAIALAVSGRTAAAVAILVVGLIVSTVDNFVRPALSRYGKLRLPTYLLFVAMLGGLTAFGAWGILLGPLFVRLAVEALVLLRSERARAAQAEEA